MHVTLSRIVNLFTLLATLLPWGATCVAATLIFDNGFESGNLTGFNCSGNCPSVNGSSKMTGNYGGDFVLTRGMATNYRTEVVLGSIGKFAFGKEYWFGFNYRYEDWAKDSNAEIAPFQVHTTPSSWSGGCNLGNAVTTAPFLMMSQNDEVQFRTYGGKIMWRAPIQKKQWLGITVHFKISASSDGFVEAWKDGVKIGSVTGRNSPALDKCGEPMKDPYFKMGVYKWDWQRTATDSSRRQVFIDNLKIVQGSNGYALVSGSAPPSDSTPPVISNVQTSLITSSSARVSWSVNESSTHFVKYGTSPSYGFTKSMTGSSTSAVVDLIGLPSNSVIYYQPVSTDLAGNPANGTPGSFKTSVVTTPPPDPEDPPPPPPPAEDTTAPVVSSVQVDASYNQASVTWATNEPGNSVVQYGVTNAYGSEVRNESLVLSHSLSIPGLQPNKIYYYRVKSKDAADNVGVGDNLSFITDPAPDETPPVPSNIQATVAANYADIFWDVNEASNCAIEYGETASYGFTNTKAPLVSTCILSIIGLEPGKTYHYRTKNTDISGNTGYSSDQTLTTPSVEPGTVLRTKPSC